MPATLGNTQILESRRDTKADENLTSYRSASSPKTSSEVPVVSAQLKPYTSKYLDKSTSSQVTLSQRHGRQAERTTKISDLPVEF